MGEGPSVAMSCGVGRRFGLDPVLLWLWCRPVATAPIRPLAWEPPYATGEALEKAKRQKNKIKFEFMLRIFPNRNDQKNYRVKGHGKLYYIEYLF